MSEKNHITGAENLLKNSQIVHDIVQEKNIREEKAVFSVQNNFVIADKRRMQNRITEISKEMEVEKNDEHKLLISYLTYSRLQEKIIKKKRENPYAVDLETKAIKDFVREKTEGEGGVTYRDQNAGKTQKKNTSKKSRNSASMTRRSKKKKNKKEKMSVTKKALYWALGGTSLGIGLV